jgi:hypothetical protein
MPLEAFFARFADELRQVIDGIARGFGIEEARPLLGSERRCRLPDDIGIGTGLRRALQHVDQRPGPLAQRDRRLFLLPFLFGFFFLDRLPLPSAATASRKACAAGSICAGSKGPAAVVSLPMACISTLATLAYIKTSPVSLETKRTNIVFPFAPWIFRCHADRASCKMKRGRQDNEHDNTY